MVVFLEISPISTEELWSSVRVTIGFLVTSLTKALLPRLLSLAGNILVPFPRSVTRNNPVLELYGQFLQPHVLVFALTCTVNCRTLYRQVCAFLNHVQLIESSCRSISRMNNGKRIHMSLISSLIEKGLNCVLLCK